MSDIVSKPDNAAEHASVQPAVAHPALQAGHLAWAAAEAQKVVGIPVATDPPRRAFGWGFLALVLVLAGGVSGAGWFYLRNEQARARRAAHKTLASIADLKVGQIAGWMIECRGNAETSFNKPQARQFLAEPDNAAVREELLQWMTTFQRVYDYSAVALFDARAAVRLSAPADEPLPYPYVQAALRAREVIVTDLHRDQSNEPIHLSLLVPVGVKPQAGQPADGVLLFLIDPQKFLYPLVQTWPTPSRTAETLLVRRDGDDALYLNEVRHRTNTALALRVPLTRTELPAVRGALGQVGPFETVDYRGVPVRAVVRSVPGTPWLMVSKVDQEEIYAPLREKAWGVGLVGMRFVLSALLGIGLLWRQQKLESSRGELAERARTEAAMRESEQRLQRAQEIAHLGIRFETKSPCHAATMGGGNGEGSSASLLFRKQINEPQAPNPGPFGSHGRSCVPTFQIQNAAGPSTGKFYALSKRHSSQTPWCPAFRSTWSPSGSA